MCVYRTLGQRAASTLDGGNGCPTDVRPVLAGARGGGTINPLTDGHRVGPEERTCQPYPEYSSCRTPRTPSISPSSPPDAPICACRGSSAKVSSNHRLP